MRGEELQNEGVEYSQSGGVLSQLRETTEGDEQEAKMIVFVEATIPLRTRQIMAEFMEGDGADEKKMMESTTKSKEEELYKVPSVVADNMQIGLNEGLTKGYEEQFQVG